MPSKPRVCHEQSASATYTFDQPDRRGCKRISGNEALQIQIQRTHGAEVMDFLGKYTLHECPQFIVRGESRHAAVVYCGAACEEKKAK